MKVKQMAATSDAAEQLQKIFLSLFLNSNKFRRNFLILLILYNSVLSITHSTFCKKYWLFKKPIGPNNIATCEMSGRLRVELPSHEATVTSAVQAFAI